MYCKSFFFIVLELFASALIFSQNIKISGYVVDANSAETLINANIVDSSCSIIGSTNKFGYYSLLLKKNTICKLKYSYIGYQSVLISFITKADTTINIDLKPGTTLSEVIINSTYERKNEEKAEISKINIPIQNIKLLPSITGEPDILKAYQLMPGVQSGSEGNNGLYVRGGTPDQNLFLLDDVPLYNVSHLGGFFSVFDPSMVKSVDLYKGGFPARYGGRISSIVDVRNKDGNLYSYKGEIGLSIFLSKIFIEGPIIKEKASFAFSIRRSNLDAYSFLYNKLLSNNYKQGYTFYDINFKANYKISQSDRAFLGIYQGRDDIYFKEKDVHVQTSNIKYTSLSDLKWGNSNASLRWLHVFKNNIFNNVTLAYTKYLYKNSVYYSRTNLTDKSNLTDEYFINSGINNFLAKTDLEIPFNQNKFRFGFSYNKNYYIPSFVSYSQKISIAGTDSSLISPKKISTLNSDEFCGYTEFYFSLENNLSGNAGVRTSYYFINSTKYPSIEPRIVLNYIFYPSYSLKASYCIMAQNIHLLTNSNTGLPSDLWIPSTSQIKPELSKQITVGLAHTTKNGYEFTIETYLKNIHNLIEYKEGALIYNSSINWDDKLEVAGNGKIKGIEVLINKKNGLLTGWIGYSISDNRRAFLNINNGNDFPFKYDQRHNISIVSNLKISNNFSLSATWVYHTGNSITLPSKKYEIYNTNYSDSYFKDRTVYSDVHVYSKKNGYQMPNYHRLDLGLNYSKKKRKGTNNWSVGVYNLYNRQNAYYVFFEKSATGETKFYQQSLFPFLLNLGYSYSF